MLYKIIKYIFKKQIGLNNSKNVEALQSHFYDFDQVDNDFDNLNQKEEFPFEYEYIYDEIPIPNSSGLIDYEVSI